MTQQPQIQTQTEANWRGFIKHHWAAFSTITVTAAFAAATSINLFVWFTANAQTTGLVPAALNLWSMSNVLTYIIYTVIWELAVVGIPVALAAIAAWQWWKHIPEAEKAGLHTGKASKGRRVGGAISPLLFIAFAIKVYVDGNWTQPIASWNLDYVVGSMVTILLWTVAIFAVPAVIVAVWWLSRK